MKKLYFFWLLGSFYTIQASSQGCVPVRSLGSSAFERPTSKKSQIPQWTLPMEVM